MPLELTPLAPGELSPAVSRASGPDVPAPAKMMAARGLAPLGPPDLVTAIYQLTHDSDPNLAESAQQSAAKLPDTILAAALSEPLDPRVIEFFAQRLLDRAELVEVILLNPATHDETFVGMAGQLRDGPLEILAGNQQRLLRHPPIMEALYFNQATRMSTVDRVLELAVRNGVELKSIPHFKELAATILGGGEEKSGEAAESEAPTQEQVDDLFASLLDGGQWDQQVDVGTLEYEAEGEEAERSKSISELPISGKIRLALLGKAGDRAALVRDSNKLVAMSVIKSPKLTDAEIVKFAGNRSICEDVIRYIAERREWHKNYQVKVSLASNPKTPLAHAMRMLPQLRGNDLRAIARSKNIPSALAQAAKRMTQR